MPYNTNAARATVRMRQFNAHMRAEYVVCTLTTHGTAHPGECAVVVDAVFDVALQYRLSSSSDGHQVVMAIK